MIDELAYFLLLWDNTTVNNMAPSDVKSLTTPPVSWAACAAEIGKWQSNEYLLCKPLMIFAPFRTATVEVRIFFKDNHKLFRNHRLSKV